MIRDLANEHAPIVLHIGRQTCLFTLDHDGDYYADFDLEPTGTAAPLEVTGNLTKRDDGRWDAGVFVELYDLDVEGTGDDPQKAMLEALRALRRGIEELRARSLQHLSAVVKTIETTC